MSIKSLSEDNGGDLALCQPIVTIPPLKPEQPQEAAFSSGNGMKMLFEPIIQPSASSSPEAGSLSDEDNVKPSTSELAVAVGPGFRFPMQCLVCNSKAKRNHYGAVVCNACGSFFRRTIANRRNYYCSVKDCTLTHASNKQDGLKRLCKYCRFQKCVEVGMIIDSIFRRKFLCEEDQLQYSTPLQRIVRARQATFVNKINLMKKIARDFNSNPRMGMYKPDAQQTIMSKMSEFEVLLLFLRDSGFHELNLSDQDCARLGCRVYYRWLFLTAVTVTLRSGGHHQKIVYFSDRGHVPVTHDDCVDFFRAHGVSLKNLNLMGSAWHELFIRGMRVGNRFHEAHLDKTEFAMIFQLLVLTEAREMFPNKVAINARMDELFTAIKRYYEENYSDVAVRLGNLVLLLSNINEMQLHIQEMALVMDMSGYHIVLPRIMQDYGINES